MGAALGGLRGGPGGPGAGRFPGGFDVGGPGGFDMGGAGAAAFSYGAGGGGRGGRGGRGGIGLGGRGGAGGRGGKVKDALQTAKELAKKREQKQAREIADAKRKEKGIPFCMIYSCQQLSEPCKRKLKLCTEHKRSPQASTRSLVHSLTRSLAHSLTRSLAHSLTRSLARFLAPSLPRSLARRERCFTMV